MFVQVIQGQVADAEQAHAALDRWVEELAPNAAGWLGTTAGVTDDGQLIVLARFESEEAARRNSEQPDQDKWWGEMSSQLSGAAIFHDSDDVVTDVVGEPDSAGFVQVMQGQGNNPDRARELMNTDQDKWAAFRPDIVGTMAAMYGDGEYTMAMYFTSEAEARVGEQKEPPPELKAQMDELNAMSTGMPTFYDLKHPWLYSPR
ncbi:hypothetical protein EV644_103294 [Kribbella orskensis]|uniref:ABM domain-containing protein n=1 Tax=Kribbella orskensis TaxID=2512216 RepID=A0ABY2BPQ8_9ACTN|nr:MULTISPECIES: hypothetical protein [Kribbella]TCN39624.1 hypothetical protein EV642_106127 [Kribbella sp. VKM Ac-2500]TCO27594.1 hypothetical protein EV644_103294 [Kribbella orskensis]